MSSGHPESREQSETQINFTYIFFIICKFSHFQYEHLTK